MTSSRIIDVYLGNRPARVGTAYFTIGRANAVTTTFQYDAAYLASSQVNIDPAFALTSGAQYVAGIPGAFRDSSPDRWGRTIIDRAERAQAREAHIRPRSLSELDYLLGVSDDTRQGALRFAEQGNEEFLGGHVDVPKHVNLPLLQRLSDEVSAGDDSAAAFKMLLNTGTTGLGGARPKASVSLANGRLGIAKFSHASDQWDVIGFEALMLDLMEKCGIRTPVHTLENLGDRKVLILERFDRRNSQRIGYISAMTALQENDGAHRDYSDIAHAIKSIAANVHAEQEELFRRAVFNCAVGNTDDHLRNHGFLDDRGFWVLSPAFDVNPSIDISARRATSIAGADHIDDEREGLLSLAAECGVSSTSGEEIIAATVRVISDWESRASVLGLTRERRTDIREVLAERAHILVGE